MTVTTRVIECRLPLLEYIRHSRIWLVLEIELELLLLRLRHPLLPRLCPLLPLHPFALDGS
jgi:hypothetical protein